MIRKQVFLTILTLILLQSVSHAQGSRRIVLNHFIADPDQISRVYITDAEGLSQDVTVTFYTEQGEIIGQKRVNLRSNGTVTINPFEVIQRRAYGKVIAEASSRVLGEYWQIVSGKFRDPKSGKDRDMNYAVGLQLAGVIDTPLKLVETIDQIRLTIEVHFDVDKADVRDVDKPNIEEAAKIIRRYFDGEIIEVEGHTDESGPADYNKTLSQKRADNVKAYLVSNFGFRDSQFRAVGYGEERPIVPGATGEAGYINRRVVFAIPKL